MKPPRSGGPGLPHESSLATRSSSSLSGPGVIGDGRPGMPAASGSPVPPVLQPWRVSPSNWLSEAGFAPPPPSPRGASPLSPVRLPEADNGSGLPTPPLASPRLASASPLTPQSDAGGRSDLTPMPAHSPRVVSTPIAVPLSGAGGTGGLASMPQQSPRVAGASSSVPLSEAGVEAGLAPMPAVSLRSASPPLSLALPGSSGAGGFAPPPPPPSPRAASPSLHAVAGSGALSINGDGGGDDNGDRDRGRASVAVPISPLHEPLLSNAAPAGEGSRREAVGRWAPLVDGLSAATSLASYAMVHVMGRSSTASSWVAGGSGIGWAAGAGMSEAGNVPYSRAARFANVAGMAAGLSNAVADGLSGDAQADTAYGSALLWGASAGAVMLDAANGYRNNQHSGWSAAVQTGAGLANAGAAYLSYWSARASADGDTLGSAGYGMASSVAWGAGAVLTKASAILKDRHQAAQQADGGGGAAASERTSVAAQGRGPTYHTWSMV